MFSQALDSNNQEESSFQLLTKRWGELPLRNPFAGSLKFEALQLQIGDLGGRTGGTGVLEWKESGARGSWGARQEGN